MIRDRIIRALSGGLLIAGMTLPAWGNDAVSDGKVTENPTAQAQNAQKSDGSKAADYPTLCRMAETNRDWETAWNFAEKWAASGEPEARQNGVLKLLELALHRPRINTASLLARAEKAGVSRVDLQLWQARYALKQRQYPQARQILEKLTAGERLSRPQLAGAMQMLLLAKLAMKDYAGAEETARERMTIAQNGLERFDAACYRVYALAGAGKANEAQTQLANLAASYPEHARVLADLQMLLAVKRGNWQDFMTRFNAGKQQKGSTWYLTACREAAELAEKTGKVQESLQIRSAALQAADSDEDRQTTILELLMALNRQQMWQEMAGTIQLYLTWYPHTPDRQRLERQTARYLVKAGKIVEALKIYDALLAGKNTDRYTAALEAAEQCAARKMAAAELKYLQQALRYAGTAAQRQEACFRQGIAHDRSGAHKLAREAFLMAEEEQGPLLEKARLFRLQSLIKDRQYDEALKVAALLSKSTVPELQAAASYHMASLHEKTGKTAQAVKAYQAFAKRFPESEFAPAALYNAALITEKEHAPAELIRQLQHFLELAPNHRLAPEAMYKIMNAREELGRTAEARQTAEKMAQVYPESLFTAAALFRLVDQAVAENRCAAALTYLARIEKLPLKQDRIQARIFFDRASIHTRLDNPRKALELLDKLLTAYASDPVAADAAELAGFLSSQLGDYTAAAVFYNRAAQLRPGGVFAYGCLERRGDCLFSAGTARNADAELLRQAEAQYRTLLQKGRAYAPLLYKIGSCREAAGDRRGALKIYSELLYRQAADRKQGQRPDPVWAPKALYAAIRLNRAKRSLDGARSVLRLIALARQIGLDPKGSLNSLEQELQVKYKL